MRVAQFEDLLGSRIEAVAGRIESSGRQASEDLMARAEELSAGIRSHVEDAERSLTNLVVNTSETIQTGARAAQQSLLTVSSDVGAQLKLTSAEVERALTAVGTGAANSILTSAREAQSTLRLGCATRSSAPTSKPRQRRSHPASILSAPRDQTTLSPLFGAPAHLRRRRLDPQTSARARRVASRTANQSRRSSDVQRRCRCGTTPSHHHRAREPRHAGPRRPVESLADAALAVAGTRASTAPATRRQSSRRRSRRSRKPESTLPVGRFWSDAANHVKSLASDVERTLTAVGADTAASILGSAREAQSSLHATSADAASQIKAISTEIERVALHGHREYHRPHPDQRAQRAEHAGRRLERSLARKVKSTSADVERSVLAASSAFGLTMTGKTDEIVSYVQQQTDRLSQMIDGKRGTLVEAIGAKTSQLTVDIDRVTSDALKVDRDPRPDLLAIDDGPTAPTSRAPLPPPANSPPMPSTSR